MSATGSDIGELVLRLARLIRHRSLTLPIPPHQARALRIIGREPIRPARLAEKLGITPRAVTDVVDALSEAGLIDSLADPADRRAKILTMTDDGERHLDAIRASRAVIANEVFASLSESERATLEELLSRCLDDASA